MLNEIICYFGKGFSFANSETEVVDYFFTFSQSSRSESSELAKIMRKSYTANPSLCSISNREKPVFITWKPCVEILHRENPALALYWSFRGLPTVQS